MSDKEELPVHKYHRDPTINRFAVDNEESNFDVNEDKQVIDDKGETERNLIDNDGKDHLEKPVKIKKPKRKANPDNFREIQPQQFLREKMKSAF
jgi:hypothetical protein